MWVFYVGVLDLQQVEEVHWVRLKVGIIFAILSTVMSYVLGLFLWPFVAYARQYPYWALPIAILLFLIYSYFVGWLVLFVARTFGGTAYPAMRLEKVEKYLEKQ